MTDYDDFKIIGQKARIVEDARKGLASKDPKRIAVARHNLEAFVNENLPGTVVDSTSNEKLQEYGEGLEQYFDDIYTGRFRRNPTGIVDEARQEYEDKFRERYLAVAPTDINGNGEHNAIAAAHAPFYILVEALKQLENASGPRDAAVFTGATTPVIMEGLRHVLADSDASDEAIERLIRLYGATYQTSEPDRAYTMANTTAMKIKEKIDRMVPEDKRANYAVRNLTARAALGDEDAKTAARDLYKIIEGRDKDESRDED